MSADWNNTSVDVKKQVIGLLDYESRCNLRVCSKTDCAVVDSTKFEAETIAITESQSTMDDNKSIIRLSIDTFNIWFIGKENVTKVDRGWGDEEPLEWSDRKQECRYEVARQFLERYSRNGLLVAKQIVFISFKLSPSENWKLKCKSLTLHDLTTEHCSEWLEKTVGQMETLLIDAWTNQVLPITPKILAVSKLLRLNLDTDMTDEQLLLVDAVELRVTSSNLTLNCVHRVLERFLKFGKEDQDFELNINLPGNFNYEQLLPKKLKFRQEVSTPHSTPQFQCRIIGGFENVHGITKARRFTCWTSGNQTSICCAIPGHPKSNYLCRLYPFTDN